MRALASPKSMGESRSRPRASRAAAHIIALSTQVQGRDLGQKRTRPLFHEVHNVLPTLPPDTTFALVELLGQRDIVALQDLQFAQIKWFEPIPDADSERGVGPDALRNSLLALINEAKKLPAAARRAGDERPPAPHAPERASRSRSRRVRRRAAKCADLAAECGAVRDLELAISIASQHAIVPSAGPRREVEALRQAIARRGMSDWSNSARIAAILGSCPKT